MKRQDGVDPSTNGIFGKKEERDKMHESRALVFFGGFNRYDFTVLWQRSQEIICWLATENKVLHVEYLPPTNAGWSIYLFNAARRMLKMNRSAYRIENLKFFFPAILPWPGLMPVREIDRFLVERQIRRLLNKLSASSEPTVWINWPTPYAYDYARHSRAFVIYDCMQNFQSSAYPAEVGKIDGLLTEVADLVFVDSLTTYREKRKAADNVYYVPQGVTSDWFSLEELDCPIDLQDLRRPILGYVGSFRSAFDFRLLADVARAKPEWTFVLVGDADRRRRTEFENDKNVLFLEKKRHCELPNYISHFDVGLIPYLVNDQTVGVFPTKFFEYLCFGKPVVSTFLPSLTFYDKRIVRMGHNATQFVEECERALMEDDQDSRKDRMLLARKNTWEARFSRMSAILGSELKKRKRRQGEKADV